MCPIDLMVWPPSFRTRSAMTSVVWKVVLGLVTRCHRGWSRGVISHEFGIDPPAGGVNRCKIV